MLIPVAEGIWVSLSRILCPRIRGIVISDKCLTRNVAHSPELDFLVNGIPMTATGKFQNRMPSTRIHDGKIEIARSQAGPRSGLHQSRDLGSRRRRPRPQ